MRGPKLPIRVDTESTSYLCRILVSFVPHTCSSSRRPSLLSIRGRLAIQSHPLSDRLEAVRNQCEAVSLRGVAQLLVPASELELFAGGERESSSKVNGVVSA